MAFSDRINESIRGRNLGFEFLSSGKHGTTKTGRMLVGPETLRVGVTTAETTAVNLAAYGISVVAAATAASSAVYTIDPPIPGVIKTIIGGTANGPFYVKTSTAASEFFQTSAGSTFTTIKISSLGGGFQLAGITTALWMTIGISTGTSSQASGFGLATST